jgi:hypothetical protein
LRNKIILSVQGLDRDQIEEKAFDVVAKYIGVSSIAEARSLVSNVEMETKQDGEIFTAEVWINLK